MTAVVVEHLRKSYGTHEVLRGMNFSVEEGEIFALLGSNGAGKTTTLEILEGFRGRDGGRVEVLGLDPSERGDRRRLSERIGLVLQDIAVEPHLSVLETVTRNAGYYPAPRDVDEVITLVGLDEKRTAKVKDLSGGQKRRLDLALGVIGDPQLLFLDEPTTGFDPGARRGAWEVVRNLRDSGTTIVLTTHYMDEVQALADSVAVMAGGQIIDSGTPATLGGRDDALTRISFLLPARCSLADLPLAAPADDAGTVTTEAAAEEVTAVLHRLTGWALDRGLDLHDLTVERPSLEDVYLSLTRPLDEQSPAEPAVAAGRRAKRSRS
ncbi:ABC transporter ATP-binding protein [Streptomyces sp. NPDC014734]|uniref:ABC transporter ATP-binding protein n=1 Tax=Streptomyces sp. NPDC014734 TaxID=3364886 RepID=UPI0036F6856C